MLIWNTFPTANGQAADIVLGWPDFGLGYGDTIASPPTASSMKYPEDVVFDGARLYVADTGNHRVMIWNGLPTTSGAPADLFVGQGGGTSGNPNAGGPSASPGGLYSPSGVTVAMNSMFVVDRDNHRVVVFTPVPTVSGTNAAAALGQDDLTSGMLAGTPSAARMSSPHDVAVMGTKLFVTDFAWQRVLRFDLVP